MEYNNPHSLRNSYKGGFSSSGMSSSPKKTLESVLDGDSGGLLTPSEVSMGLKVKHKKFGIGTIVSFSKADDDIKLTVAFDKNGVKTLMLSIAALEKL